MRQASSLFFLAATFIMNVFLGSCANDAVNVTVKLEYGGTPSAAQELIEQFETTVRVMYRYDRLERGSWVIAPSSAFPKFIPGSGEQTEKVTLWEKSSGEGFNIEDGVVLASNIPIGQKDFKLLIEFIQPFTDQVDQSVEYYVVAYACYEGPGSTTKISEEQLKQDLEVTGLKIYAGRSCGECPIKEAFQDQDHPQFTVANLAGTTPPDCP